MVAVRIIAAGRRCVSRQKQLILALRAAGLRHGQLRAYLPLLLAEDDERVRFQHRRALLSPVRSTSVTSGIPSIKGISVFAIMPAEEDGVQLFDDMVSKARELAKAIDGAITDEQGGAFSLQRERYMREELIDYLRRQEFSIDPDRDTAA